MKKDLATIGGLLVIVLVLIVFQGFGAGGFVKSPSPSTSTTSSGSANVEKNRTTVVIDKLTIDAKVSSSASERQKGLSGLDSLPLDQGMLFVFDKSAVYPFWMKDMKFAIDIIWINDQRKVVDIAQNVPIEPGKSDKDLTIYRPTQNAKYVLEVNAGLVSFYNIKAGDPVQFSL